MPAIILDWWSMTRKRLGVLSRRLGVVQLDGPFLDFRDPWGNRIEIVGYANIHFTKARTVLRGMGLTHLTKNENTKKELAKKGMAIE